MRTVCLAVTAAPGSGEEDEIQGPMVVALREYADLLAEDFPGRNIDQIGVFKASNGLTVAWDASEAFDWAGLAALSKKSN